MKTRYMCPYVAGFLLGLVLLAAIFVTGRGLGASGAIKDVVLTSLHAVAPAYTEHSSFFGAYFGDGEESPMKSWLVFEVIGVFIGAFLSGLVSDRLKIVTEAGPRVSSRRRWIFALIGGALFGAGAQFARGCTSGATLSGMAVLSMAGFVTMLAIFGTGYAVAYVFRKLWI
jgi:uncharacterized membrane protein YedE/YeeE